jgi:hypothetical protein
MGRLLVDDHMHIDRSTDALAGAKREAWQGPEPEELGQRSFLEREIIVKTKASKAARKAGREAYIAAALLDAQ